MLRLNEIKLFFPSSLHRFPRFMLREYLQYKILEIVFTGPFANALCFLGGHLSSDCAWKSPVF